MPVRFFVELGARAIVASTSVPRRPIWPRAPNSALTSWRRAKSWRSRGWRKRRMMVASGCQWCGGDDRKRPIDRDVVQCLLGGLLGDREPLAQEGDPEQLENWVRRKSRGPRRGLRGNPGDEGIAREEGEHLLELGLPAHALDGSFATVREDHLVRAAIIPGQAPPPLPF